MNTTAHKDRDMTEQPIRQMADVALASAAVASPIWAPYVEQLNLIMTSLGLFGGLVLLFWRLQDAYKRRKAGKPLE